MATSAAAIFVGGGRDDVAGVLVLAIAVVFAVFKAVVNAAVGAVVSGVGSIVVLDVVAALIVLTSECL